jgi:hypothetical protein
MPADEPHALAAITPELCKMEGDAPP